MQKSYGRILVVVVLVALVVAYRWLGLGDYLSLDYLKARQGDFQAFYAANRAATLAAFVLVYVATTALSLPGATILTLAGGALFGFGPGLLAVSVASTVGATLAFLVSRFLLRDAVLRRFGDRLGAINEGVRREGAFYLFTLRLVPLFPFFVINLVMGLTPLRTWTFFWVSQLGMLPGTAVYVNAGTQLARIDSLGGILSPALLASFALLGVFPLVAKKTLDALKARRALAKWPKPKRFDYNLVVVGAGSGGLVSAYIAAAVKAKVALIEKKDMGGDCLNTGCVPSKALIRSAKMLSYAQRAKEFGFKETTVSFDFADVMERVQRVIKQIEPHDSVERYTGLGVECIKGAARVRSPWEVEVEGRTLTTRSIVIATGGGPLVPPIEGLASVGYLTSDTIWGLRTLPRRFLVLGAGPIGCELAQCFRRFGAAVTIVDRMPRLLAREDPEVSAEVGARFSAEGIEQLVEHEPRRFFVEGGEKICELTGPGGTRRVAFDEVLVAIGRKAHATGFGLEELGVRLEEKGTIEHDALMRTSIPTIYCVGDVAGPFQLTHAAAHQAWYAAVNALFGPFKTFKADYRVLPRVTFTDPEVATVGLTETEAKARGVAYEAVTYGLDDLDRAIADGEAHGFVKVLTPPGKDTILGATVVGTHAGDFFVELVTAMRHGLGLNKVLGTVHAYPTLGEANKYAAGVWKKKNAPQRLLGYVERFHAWRRG